MSAQKKVLGFVGSPRKNGNTHLLVSKILEGAQAGGASTELIFLDDLEIHECDGCHLCWNGNPCSKNDDLEEVFDRIAESDVLVFGTPVYWYGPTALMKGLVDRFVYFNCPENRVKIQGKRAVLAVPFEEEGRETADLIVAFFERSLEYLEVDLFGTVLAPGVTRLGEIRERKEFLDEGYELGRKVVSEGAGRKGPGPQSVPTGFLRGKNSGSAMNTGDVVHYSREMLPLVPDVPGSKMWAVSLENTMFTYFEMEPRSRFERHSHRSEQITMVLEGELIFEMDGKTERISSGEVIAVPSEIPHAVYAGEEKVKAVDAWSPVICKYAKK